VKVKVAVVVTVVITVGAGRGRGGDSLRLRGGLFRPIDYCRSGWTLPPSRQGQPNMRRGRGEVD